MTRSDNSKKRGNRGDPARPSSSWRYRIDPLPPDRAAGIMAASRDGLLANMNAALRAMKAAAESS